MKPHREAKKHTQESGIRMLGESYKDVMFNFDNCDGILIANCKFENCILRISHCQHVSILDNSFDQCDGSHFIQFVPTEPCEHVTIVRNSFRGKGTAFVRGKDEEPLPNGACGDIVAIRNVRHFHVCDNQMTGGGEFGITVLHGACDGVVSNNTIENNDATGIQIGGPDQQSVERVAVHNNWLSGCGQNHQGDAINQMGIRVQNIVDVVVSKNSVVRPGKSLRYGLVASHFQGLTISGNNFETETKFRIPKVEQANSSGLLTDIPAQR